MPAHINIKKKSTNGWLERKKKANEVMSSTYWINQKVS